MEDFRLKVFRVVAECLSFTQAAERLFLTQPAVTLQIKALEESLGASLFDRSNRQIKLTPAGEVLRNYATQIVELCDNAKREIGALTGDASGRLKLGASTTIAQYVLPRIVGEFAAKHPRIEFSIISANTENIVAALLEKRIALGVIEAPANKNEIKSIKFIADEIVCICAANHEWTFAESDEIKVESLRDAPLIMRESGSGTRRIVENGLRVAGLRTKNLRVVMNLDSTEAIKSAVENNLGVGFVSRQSLTKELKIGSLKIVNIENTRFHRQFQFAYLRGLPLSETVKLFVRFARQNA